MSRGGGGFRGGRGGRGGGRGGRGGPALPWESDEVDGRPSETFPAYSFRPAGSLTDAENRYVTNFLLYQRQVHEGPLNTKKHTVRDPTRPRRIYDQQQRNKQYAVKTKATVDVFTAVETWSSRFKPHERNLPDFSTRPYVKRIFPAELHTTLDGTDGPARSKKRQQQDKKLKLSSVTSLRTAEEVYRMNGAGGEGFDAALMKKLEMGEAPEEGQEEAAYDSEAAEEEEEDYAYDDEDAGDYDAEAYFDDGEADGDDGDDGGDDGGYY